MRKIPSETLRNSNTATFYMAWAFTRARAKRVLRTLYFRREIRPVVLLRVSHLQFNSISRVPSPLYRKYFLYGVRCWASRWSNDGLLYFAAPLRLCSNYLTGKASSLKSVRFRSLTLIAIWIIKLYRDLNRHYQRKEGHMAPSGGFPVKSV